MKRISANHKTRSLVLVSMLHAFTHLYQVALMPLYLPMQKTFQLRSVGWATFLVTVQMVAYFLPSYPMGVLADRFSRKKLLGIGLAIQGLGFLLLAWAPYYSVAVLAMVVAGFGGSFFHPAATALIARLYPVNTGRALGIIGIGAGVGFFIGPIYAGWRATQTGHWREPVFELGLLGLAGAALFHWLAEETPTVLRTTRTEAATPRMFYTPGATGLFVAAAFAFSLRDFAGSSMGSLGSLFLQKAHGYTLQQTGIALSGIFLASVISNPLFGHLSDRGRKRWTCLVLSLAAAMVALFPHLAPGWFFVAFMAYGFFFMASYPMVEAGVMQAVPDAVRGRAFGLWITIGGLLGNLSHWLVGGWVAMLHDRAARPSGYFGLYAMLGACVLLSLAGLPCLEAIRQRKPALQPSKTDSALPLPHSALDLE